MPTVPIARAALLLGLSLLCEGGCGAPTPSSSLWEHPWRMGKLSAVRLGPAFALARVTPLEELTSTPSRFLGQKVRTVGRIASTCHDYGCWIDLWPLRPGGEGVFVTSRGKLFSNPLDCPGRRAEVEGQLEVKTYPVARLRHWSHHGWRPGLPIQGPMQVYRIEATTVEIH